MTATSPSDRDLSRHLERADPPSAGCEREGQARKPARGVLCWPHVQALGHGSIAATG
jgi:hypothetical protein